MEGKVQRPAAYIRTRARAQHSTPPPPL